MVINNRFFMKIFGGYLLIIALLTVLLLTIAFRSIEDHFINALSESLEHLNTSLEPQIAQLVVDDTLSKLDTYIKETGKRIDTRLTVIDANGFVLADSENDPRKMENHGYRGEIIDALAGQRGKYIRFSKTMQRTMLYIASPLRYQEKTVGVIRSSLYLSDIDNLLKDLRKNILRIAAFVIFLALLGTMLYSRNLVRPIEEITNASRNIASGNFKTRVLLKRSKDFKTLADAFNRMSEQLSQSFSDLAVQRDELKTIIASIQGGLLVLDKEGRIMLYNEGIEKIAVGNVDKGKFYWEVFRDPNFTAIVNKSREDKEGITEELALGSRTFLCSVNYLKTNSELVCILHDITDIKNLQQIKKDFVINVSHELRTPLTAIKGFIETLEEEVTPEHKHYLGIITKHTNRLINIVNDLLILSEVEDRSSLEVEDISLSNLQENITRIFDERLADKKLDFTWSNPENVTSIKGDLFKIEQVLINLIDNAIKYTDTGKIAVTISQRNNRNLIEISDTGIGIPEDQQVRIFERFYTVDKSRSRRLGGTGLGLSIAKHIILLHQGELTVQSTPGKGTTFKIELPINI